MFSIIAHHVHITSYPARTLPSKLHSFIYEYLPHVRHWAGYWGDSCEQDTYHPCPQGMHSHCTSQFTQHILGLSQQLPIFSNHWFLLSEIPYLLNTSLKQFISFYIISIGIVKNHPRIKIKPLEIRFTQDYSCNRHFEDGKTSSKHFQIKASISV